MIHFMCIWCISAWPDDGAYYTTGAIVLVVVLWFLPMSYRSPGCFVYQNPGVVFLCLSSCVFVHLPGGVSASLRSRSIDGGWVALRGLVATGFLVISDGLFERLFSSADCFGCSRRGVPMGWSVGIGRIDWSVTLARLSLAVRPHDAAVPYPPVCCVASRIGGVDVRPVVYQLSEKHWVYERGVKVVEWDGGWLFVQQRQWGGCHYLGDIERVPGGYGLTNEFVHLRAWEMLKKADARRAELHGDAALVAGDYGILYPTLWSYLTQARWDDGTERKTSSVTVFCDGGQLKCVLKDKETNLSLWASGVSFETMLSVLEALLNDPTAVWRQDKQETGASGRVKPRKG